MNFIRIQREHKMSMIYYYHLILSRLILAMEFYSLLTSEQGPSEFGDIFIFGVLHRHALVTTDLASQVFI